jgi:DNA replication and repair protein RecF
LIEGAYAMAPDGVSIVDMSSGIMREPGMRTGGAANSARPAVSRLGLRDFRCYDAVDLKLNGRLVVLTGPNGAGKTNLLEAVSFLAPGRGLRRATMAEAERHGSGAKGWAVAATLETTLGPVEIGTGRVAESPERRAVRIDGVTQRSQSSLAPLVAVAWLTPQMDRIFIEGASARRRFLDRLAYGIDAEQATRLGVYEHAMRERAKLLRDGRFERSWLDALEETMAAQGVAIAAARIALVRGLSAVAEAEIEPFPAPDLALAGELESALEAEPALAVEEAFRARLAANRRIDADAGATTAGPHRSDFVVGHRVKGMAASACSTGEQKALLIAIQLANARLVATTRGEPPLLLLDEIAAHLDRARLAALFSALDGLGGQVWMTGTEPELFHPLRENAQFLAVLDGRVETV